jgi:hypothetical protein
MLKLQKKLKLSKEYIGDAVNRSKSVIVSEEEAKIVNRWSKPDVLIDMIFDEDRGSYSQRLNEMIEGKVDDYKIFVTIYEDYNHSLPKNIYRYMLLSPCGRAKLDALEMRYR